MLTGLKIKLSVLMILFLALPVQGRDVCTVKKVIDGDTIKIICGAIPETVRLIGVDTPESKKNRKAKRDAKRTGQDIEAIIANGRKAAMFITTIVKQGDPVIIEYDRQKRDRYRRLLGYVYLSAGEMLNEELLKTGHATLMPITQNVRYQERFLKSAKK